MKRPMKKSLWAAGGVVIVAVICALVLFSQKKADPAQDDPLKTQQVPADARAETLVVASGSEPPSLTTTEHNAQAGTAINLLLYNTLVKYDEKLNPVPDLAESYENISETEWIFHLRHGVKFHDGKEMTAADVAASIEHAQKSPEVSLYSSSVAKIEEVDSYTVKITTDGPAATLIDQLCQHGNSILPKELLDKGNNFNKNPIGTGPYRFLRWVPGERVELEAFSGYFDRQSRPALKYLIWRVIPEGATRTAALERGEVDYVVDIETGDVEQLAKNQNITVSEVPSTAQTSLMLNNTAPGLNRQDVRRAIYSAIDREKVVKTALNGHGIAAYAQAPANLEGATTEGCDPYDPELAKSLMAQSGIDPSKLNLSIICSNSTKKRAALSIQEDLSQLGITCDITMLDLATYLATTSEGNYTAAVGGFSTGDMISYLVGVFHSNSITTTNRCRLNNAMVDMLIDEAAKTLEASQRKDLLRQCNSLLNSLCPQVPLYQEAVVQAYASDLKGVKLSPLGIVHFNEVSRDSAKG